MTRTVALLIYDRFMLLDAAGPISTFEVPARLIKPAPYRIKVIAPTAGPVTSTSGVQMIAEDMRKAGPIDTLIVAGGEGSRVINKDRTVIDFLIEQAPNIRRVCSVCTGAYVLAGAGLLDQKRITTHWQYCQRLATSFPNVSVEPDRIHVKDGKFWTSAGVTAGIDLSLALIADDLGEAASRQAAQQLVVYHRRPGGQSQFSALLSIDKPASRFSELLSWIRENLTGRLDVEHLAERCGMSARNFARAFVAEMGVTPAKAVERVRIEAARAMVESGEESFEQVALGCGFNDADRMRRAFLRTFGQPPQTLRRNAA